MDYLIAKSIHIIFVVSYFAGIFYLVRLFIYNTEALGKNEPERSILHKQYNFMQDRLWNIITVPAFIIMLISGIYILYCTGWGFLHQGWMHVKLLFVLLLCVYHFWCWTIIKQLKQGRTPMSSVQLRMINEIATLILFVVVFAVVLKNLFIQYFYTALISFVLLGMLIMLIVKIVNRKR